MLITDLLFFRQLVDFFDINFVDAYNQGLVCEQGPDVVKQLHLEEKYQMTK